MTVEKRGDVGPHTPEARPGGITRHSIPMAKAAVQKGAGDHPPPPVSQADRDILEKAADGGKPITG